ncbi:hypothetical protein EVAR_5904_1 [Eumeta japonica]|uniref:Reverse transcriptase RNase H-like domain-containing protein n=1 Tax=Eumeta variegata TaxID=151549 RepID=A0A4C1TD64_EUMVA|nr:hypothetical protein EVAR_5904_1 [Eumeta japonica]
MGKPFEEFYNALRDILNRFGEANLIVKSSKSSFGYELVTVHFENSDDTVVTCLFVDASEEALDASLIQGEKELRQMHSVAYVSRKLNNLKKKYSATERKCLGVLWALIYSRHYVWGMLLEVVMDRKASYVTVHTPCAYELSISTSTALNLTRNTERVPLSIKVDNFFSNQHLWRAYEMRGSCARPVAKDRRDRVSKQATPSAYEVDAGL